MTAAIVKRAIIVGAGVAGQELLAELRKHLKRHYKVVGFVDDDKAKHGKRVEGVAVLGGTEELHSLVKRHTVEEVFIAIPSAQGATIRRVVEACKKERVLFRIVPRILEIVQGKVRLHQVREIQVEDLLGRAILQAKQSIFTKKFKGKKILVTGAAGSIGSELCRQVVQFNPRVLIAFDWWENGMFELGLEIRKIAPKVDFQDIIGNIQDYKKVRQAMHQIKPDIVFHAAAFKHVPLMQKYPEEAIKNNVFGTQNVARAAYRESVKKFVYISTDKAVDPNSVMGATKLIGEQIVSSYDKKGKTRYMSVRFGNVLDSYGSVVPIFRKQIAEGGPVTVTDPKMVRYFMIIPEAAQLVLQATVLGKGGEIFILDMGEPVKIVELAELMIRLSGFVPGEDIQIKYIGKRPGEKLSEELTTKLEQTEKTESELIYKINKNGDSKSITKTLLNKLRKAAEGQDRERVFEILKEFAPNLQKQS